MTPRVGQIVLYYKNVKPLAAIITEVSEHFDSRHGGPLEEQQVGVHLAVFPPGDSYGQLWPMTTVPFSPKPKPDHWTWPA